jgi:hypothetical protein
MAADPVSLHVGQFEGVRSLGDLRSLGDSVNLGAEATNGLASDQSTSAFPGSQTRFRENVIIIDFDHNVVLETAPPSVLKLPVKWPAIKIPVLSGVSIVPSVPVSLRPQEVGGPLDSSQIVASIKSLVPVTRE